MNTFLPSSPRATARVAGLCYLVIIVCGIFAQAFVRGSLIEGSDAAATAENIRTGEALLRLGLMADFIVYVLDAVLAVLFYILLAPVDRKLALLAAAIRIAMTAVLAFNLLNEVAPLVLISNPALTTGLPPESVDGLILFFLEMHSEGFVLGLMFFGVHCTLLSILLMRAQYFPRLIGRLMGICGLSYLAIGIIHFALPAFSGFGGWLLLSAALPEFIFTGWLLIVGLNQKKWDERVGKTAM